MSLDKESLEQITQDLLKKPYAFWNLVKEHDWVHNIGIFPEIIIKNKEISKILGDIPFDIFIEVHDAFIEKLDQIKSWLQRSEVRILTFQNLGFLETATASQIGQKVGKHPKSISNYIREFDFKGWVELIEDDDARTKRYRLTDAGDDYYKIATEDGWFEFTPDEEIFTEHVILKVDYDKILFNEDDLNLLGIDDLSFSPSPNELIKKIKQVSKSILERLNLKIVIPPLRIYNLRNEKHPLTKIISPVCDGIIVGSVNDDELALIFAAFNFLQHFQMKRGPNLFSPFINQLKLVKADYYFSEQSEANSEKAFLSPEKTKEFISVVLQNFRSKYDLKGE